MAKHDSNALILLSTYNGANYLSEQLNSLLTQDFLNWTLLVRDDGSTDNTVSIVKQYANLDPRIILLEDSLGNLNVPQSFSILMKHALNQTVEWIFFCDQDDVWQPQKLSLSIAKLSAMEKEYGKETPLLIHTDLTVVDRELNSLHPSFLTFEKINRNANHPLRTLLINNFVTGCTIGMNQALLKLAYPIPEHAMMHDWWCALLAAASGKIGFVPKALILYRQHGKNSVGSIGFYGKFLQQFLHFPRAISAKKINFMRCFAQAQALLPRIVDENNDKALIEKFCQLPKQSLLSRYASAFHLLLKGTNKIRTLIFFGVLGLL